MGSAPSITSIEEHFVRSPYSEVLYVLQDAERLGEDEKKLKPKDIRAGLEKLEAKGQSFLRLLQEIGISREEMLQVQVENIDIDMGWIRIADQGKKERHVSVQDTEIVDMLGEYIGDRERGPLFSPKSVALSSKARDISPARLSQVLRQLLNYGLVEKESGRYWMSNKHIHAFRRDYICEKLSYDDKGEMNWGKESWWLSGAVLDDSDIANEVRKELKFLASSFFGKRIMGKIDKLNRMMRMEEIAEHMLGVFKRKKLGKEKRGYVLHHVRSEIRNTLKMRFFNEALDRTKEPGESPVLQLDDVSDMVETILKDEWDAIIKRKLGNTRGFLEIDRIAKEYDEGKEATLDDEFLEWLYFKAFEGKKLVFGGYPLLVLGDFNRI